MPGPSDAYGAEVYGDTPIAYWRFDGDGVDVMGGTSATLNNGATYGTTVVSTYSGAQALSVDGSNDNATVPDDNKFDFTYNLTLEAWFKATTLTGTGVIVGKFDWGFAHYDTEIRIFSWYNSWASYAWATPIATGTTYHIVVTLDGTTIRMYANGSQVIATARTDPFNVNGQPVEIGSWNNGGQDFFDGLIDEVAVYNRAITSTEVTDHYTAGTAAAGGKSRPIPRRPARGLILR